jgi:hypothetical protein
MIASDVLEPHLSSADAYVTWSLLTTNRSAGGPAFKGGVSTWSKLQRELQLLLHDSSTTVLTTLLDYYAFRGQNRQPVRTRPLKFAALLPRGEAPAATRGILHKRHRQPETY